MEDKKSHFSEGNITMAPKHMKRCSTLLVLKKNQYGDHTLNVPLGQTLSHTTKT